MELREAIVSRRSVRSFLDKKVERADLEKILSAAVFAPSAGNLTPWRFWILDDPDLIDKACRFNLDAFWGLRAPAAIVVTAEIKDYRRGELWIQDCAAITQNILLLAHDHGLGATWTGVYPIVERVEGIANLLRLPEQTIPFAMIILGHPKAIPSQRDRSVQGRIHYNRSISSKPPTSYIFVSDRKPK
jgi:nitroreductase